MSMISKVRFAGLQPYTQGNEGVLCPRLVFASIAVVYSALCCVWLERQVRLATREQGEGLGSRDGTVPNYYYVNNDRDIFYLNKGRGEISQFAKDYMKVSGNWSLLCHMDSDFDGWTNGQELGDPCCQWKKAPPHGTFSLDAHLEYRRWCITNPGDNQSSWLNPGGQYPAPMTCNAAYAPSAYESHYRGFYYADVHEPVQCDPTQVKHWIGIVSVCMLYVYWFRKGLIKDLLPMTLRSTKISLGVIQWVVTCVLAFLYMDLISGAAHLCLDYSPQWIPVLGPMANSFQMHHMMPSKLPRSCGHVWLNDAFTIVPFPVIVLIGVNPARVSRMFWFWSLTYAFLFLAAHPWAHMPQDMLPWLVDLAQRWGVLLDQEAHMRHHGDLQSQFTILSGHTDVVIDSLTRYVVPPHRYDIWLFIFVTWLLTPMALDIKYRNFLNSKTLPTFPFDEAKLDKV